MSRNFWIVVRSRKKKYSFAFFAWVSQNQSEWRMDDTFYVEKFGRLPDGQHAEFIIYSEEIIEHPFTANDPLLLHMALNKDGKNYCICWPTLLTEFPLDTGILMAWCVGTVYTLETGTDFAQILNEQNIAQGDFDTFIKYMRQKQKIAIKSIQDGD